MRFINRAAVIIKAKQPMVDWLNKIENTITITLDQLNEDCVVVLVPEKDSNEQIRAYVTRLKPYLFAQELAAWYTDESLWPVPLTARLFNKWFELDIHTMVRDAVDQPIIHEDWSERG